MVWKLILKRANRPILLRGISKADCKPHKLDVEGSSPSSATIKEKIKAGSRPARVRDGTLIYQS